MRTSFRLSWPDRPAFGHPGNYGQTTTWLVVVDQMPLSVIFIVRGLYSRNHDTITPETGSVKAYDPQCHYLATGKVSALIARSIDDGT